MSSEDMYVDAILDHYKNPQNFGRMRGPDATASDVNPLCGDQIEIQLKIQDNKIMDIRFIGQGCAISQAAASMLTEALKGEPISRIREMNKDDMIRILGIHVSPVRLKCALLGLKVTKLAAYSYLNEKMTEKEEESL